MRNTGRTCWIAGTVANSVSSWSDPRLWDGDGTTEPACPFSVFTFVKTAKKEYCITLLSKVLLLYRD